MSMTQDVAIFDFDKTIFRYDSIVGICEYMRSLKRINIDIWSNDYRLHYNREVNLMLKKLRVAEIFRGMAKDDVQSIFCSYAYLNKDNYFTNVYNEVLNAKMEGCLTICLSASFENLVSALLNEMNCFFDVIAGTKLEYHNGICTGKIDGMNLSGFNKFIWLKDWINQNKSKNIQIRKCYTDHISDSQILLLSKERYVVKLNHSFDDWSALIDDVKYILV